MVEENLKFVYDEMKPYREHKYFVVRGGFDTWFKAVASRAEDTDGLRKTFESESEKHKTSKLPVRQIII